MLRVTTVVFLSGVCANGLAKGLFTGLPDPSSPIVLLPTPSRPSASLSGSTVVVSWPAVSLANRYYVQPIKNGVVQADVIAALPFEYVVTASASYQFKVKACNGPYQGIPDPVEPPIIMFAASGTSDITSSSQVNTLNGSETCSAWSESSTAVLAHSTPSAPGGLVSNLSGSVISISWNSVNNATSYRIRQSVNGNWQAEINKGAARAHNFTISTNNIYSYQVKGCNSAMLCSDWSNTLTVNTSPTITYIHTDILGSVVGESNQNGVLLKKTHYKPYGERKEQ